MPKLTPTDWKTQLKIFQAYGCKYKRKKGSHHILTCPNAKRAVVIPEKGGIHSSLVRLVGDGICLQSYLRRALDQFAAPVPVNDKRAILVILRCAG